MKVAFALVEGSDPCDAQAIWLQRLLPELKRLGFDIVVYFYAAVHPSRCRSLKVFSDHGIKCLITRNLGTTANFVRWYLKCLRETKPDVFVPQHVTFALYAARWARESGIPTLAVLHSDDPPCRSLVKQFGRTNNSFAVSGFVAVSVQIADQTRCCVGDEFRISYIPCGVPMPEAVATPPNGHLRICYLGRMIQHQKRILDVVKSFCRVVRKYPTVEAYLWGDGAERTEVEKILKSEALGLPVYCPGPLAGDEAQAALRSCHAVVLLSDWEGTPTVFMEGMAAGVVPIARRIGGGTEALVENGVTGIILEEDPDALVQAVGTLMDGNCWVKLSKAAREKIRHGFTSEVCAARWADLLNELDRGELKDAVQNPFFLKLPLPDPFLARERRLPIGLNSPARFLWRVKQFFEDFKLAVYDR
jgi:colanic acid/amylovoran biosynthesis glycosyltransferase